MDQGYLEAHWELWLVSLAAIRGQGLWQGTGPHFLGAERPLLSLCLNLDLHLEVYYLLLILRNRKQLFGCFCITRSLCEKTSLLPCRNIFHGGSDSQLLVAF